MISMSQLVIVQSMTSSRTKTSPATRSLPRRLAVFFAASAGALALAAVPVGAQTYSDGSDGTTGQGTDTNTTPITSAPGASDSGNGGTSGTGDVVAQAEDNGALAFTGSDSMSLALIGAGIVTAGGLLVVSSRRKVELPV